MSKFRLVLLLFLGLLLAGVVVFYFRYISPSALSARVKGTLEQSVNARITLGKAYFSPVTGLTLNGLIVRTKTGGETLFRAKRVFIKPYWLSLTRFRFVIRKLSLQDAELMVKNSSSGGSNWSGVFRKEAPSHKGPLPILSLRNGKVTINERVYRGLNCELSAFPSKYLIAVRGTIHDPLWGNYLLHGDVNVREESLRLSFESSEDFDVTEEWMFNFPRVGFKIWDKYHPVGLFGLTGKLTLCWGEACTPDINLVFTAKDSSCKWLVFPVHNATGMLFVNRNSIILNNLDGSLFGGEVKGYSIVNLTAPFTFFNRYSFDNVALGEFLKDFQTEEKSLKGKARGYVEFQGDHSLDFFRGKGELTVPEAKLWKFPIIVNILSQLQLTLRKGEPYQDCRIVFSFTQKGLTFKEISLVSPVFDIYGDGTAGWNGKVDLTFYVKPVSKTPILLADLLLQPALDSISGNMAQFRITGTVRNPSLTVIPLTPVRKHIVNFFDAVTKQRLTR